MSLKDLIALLEPAHPEHQVKKLQQWHDDLCRDQEGDILLEEEVVVVGAASAQHQMQKGECRDAITHQLAEIVIV